MLAFDFYVLTIVWKETHQRKRLVTWIIEEHFQIMTIVKHNRWQES